MSILLDALKKSEEQRQLGKVPNIHSPSAQTRPAAEGWQQIVRTTSFDSIQEIEDPKTDLKTFYAKGRGTIQMLRLADDALFPKKKCSFIIEAKEGVDDIGLPDIDVQSLTIEA